MAQQNGRKNRSLKCCSIPVKDFDVGDLPRQEVTLKPGQRHTRNYLMSENPPMPPKKVPQYAPKNMPANTKVKLNNLALSFWVNSNNVQLQPKN